MKRLSTALAAFASLCGVWVTWTTTPPMTPVHIEAADTNSCKNAPILFVGCSGFF